MAYLSSCNSILTADGILESFVSHSLLLFLSSFRANSKLGTESSAYSQVLMPNIHFVSSAIMSLFNNIFHCRCSLWHLETLLELSVPNHCFPNVQDTYSPWMAKFESQPHLKNLTYIERCSPPYKVIFTCSNNSKKFRNYKFSKSVHTQA